MSGPAHPAGALVAWRAIPGSIEEAIAGLAEQDLELRGGADGMSIRETVHHLAEAGLIASNIILAALARGNGTVFDWSWVYPNAAWNERMGYAGAPVAPALRTLSALGEHIGGLIERRPDALQQEVRLLDAPGAALYARSVEGVLEQEVEHAHGHLRGVAETRKAHGR
jgi:hypothetical protein